MKKTSPPDPAEQGIHPTGIVGNWELYMDQKIVVYGPERNVRYWLSFGFKSTHVYFWDDDGRRQRVAGKNSEMYHDVMKVLDDWKHAKLVRSMLE